MQAWGSQTFNNPCKIQGTAFSEGYRGTKPHKHRGGKAHTNTEGGNNTHKHSLIFARAVCKAGFCQAPSPIPIQRIRGRREPTRDASPAPGSGGHPSKQQHPPCSGEGRSSAVTPWAGLGGDGFHAGWGSRGCAGLRSRENPARRTRATQPISAAALSGVILHHGSGPAITSCQSCGDGGRATWSLRSR